MHMTIIFKHLLCNRLVKAKLYALSIVRKGEIKVCINGKGHMTNMATMAINSKILKKSSSSEPEGL